MVLEGVWVTPPKKVGGRAYVQGYMRCMCCGKSGASAHYVDSAFEIEEIAKLNWIEGLLTHETEGTYEPFQV